MDLERRTSPYLALSLLLAACARAPVPLYAGAPERPTHEHVFLYPLPDALAATRQVLEHAGFLVEPYGDGTQLMTRWRVHGPQAKVDTATFTAPVLQRYYVQGLALNPRQTVVRIFRIDRLEDAPWYEDEEPAEHVLAAELAPREAAPSSGSEEWRAFVGSGLAPEVPARVRDETRPEDTLEQGKGTRGRGGNVTRQLRRGATAGLLRDPRFAGQYRMPTQEELRGRNEAAVRDLLFERELVARLEQFPSLEFTGGPHDVPPPPAEAGAAPLTDLWQRQGDGTPFSHPADACGEPVEGLAAVAARGGTVLVGEPLGTREVPAAVGNLACQLARDGHAVVLGLALPREEQPGLERYVASAGTRADQEALLGGSFWRLAPRDGRSSRALVGLLERVRRWRAAGLDVRPLAYDVSDLKQDAREEAIARLLLARRRAEPHATLLVLGGNYHVRDAVGAPWSLLFEPFGHRLERAGVPVVALDTAFRRGTRWACGLTPLEALECRVYAAAPTDETLSPPERPLGVERFAGRSADGFHGLLHVGALSHSVPALVPRPASR